MAGKLSSLELRKYSQACSHSVSAQEFSDCNLRSHTVSAMVIMTNIDNAQCAVICDNSPSA